MSTSTTKKLREAIRGLAFILVSYFLLDFLVGWEKSFLRIGWEISPFVLLGVVIYVLLRRYKSGSQKVDLTLWLGMMVCTSLVLVLLVPSLFSFWMWSYGISSRLGERLTSAMQSIYARQESNKRSFANENRLAECAWLRGVPENWHCQDEWNGRERHLIAENPERSGQNLELQIDGGNYLKGSCVDLWPVGFFVRISPSGITMPNLCLGGWGLGYRADWVQDGYFFRLLGRGVSRELFLQNLDTNRGPYPSDTANLTFNPEIVIEPKTISLRDKKLVLSLKNTDLCREGGKAEIKEVPKIWLDSAETPLDFEPVRDKECIINVFLEKSEVTVGEHSLIYEVNYLRQRLKDKVLVAN